MVVSDTDHDPLMQTSLSEYSMVAGTECKLAEMKARALRAGEQHIVEAIELVEGRLRRDYAGTIAEAEATKCAVTTLVNTWSVEPIMEALSNEWHTFPFDALCQRLETCAQMRGFAPRPSHENTSQCVGSEESSKWIVKVYIAPERTVYIVAWPKNPDGREDFSRERSFPSDASVKTTTLVSSDETPEL